MKSTVENLSPTRVRLAVEVPFDELRPSMDKAYKTLAGQVRIPGFRPGKVPPRVIDQRVGRAAVLEQAVNEAIPEQYSAAVREHGVKVLGQPEVDVTGLDDGEQLSFTVEVDVRPDIDLPDYGSLSVTVDGLAVPAEDVEEQVDAQRQRFAVLKGVERPVQAGDYVTLDLVATVDGEQVEGGSMTGQSYEVGTDSLVPGVDDVLVGMSSGESKTFQTELVGGENAGKSADIGVTVRSVKEKELPELDDDFAQTASEFDTLDELRADIATRLSGMRAMQQGFQARDLVLEALLDATDVPLPEKVLENETDFRRRSVNGQLENAGLTMDAYLEHEDKTAEQFDAELVQAARSAVKAQLVLDAIADKEEVGVNDAELTEELLRRAQTEGVAPQEYAQRLMDNGALPGLVSDVRRGKALAQVLESATVRDEAGNDVDLERLGEQSTGPVAPESADDTADDTTDAGASAEAPDDAPDDGDPRP